MKILNKIFLAAGALATIGGFTACTEEATLDGANVVYVEISPSDITLTAGQSLPVSCLVTNESGDAIPVDVEWTVDDPSVARFYRDTTYRNKLDIAKIPVINEFGDTVKTAAGTDSIRLDTTVTVLSTTVTNMVQGVKGAQGRSTFLRATLPNGKYAIRQVSVIANTLGDCLEAYTKSGKRTYFNYPAIDTIWFKVEPLALIEDYTPKFKFDVTDLVVGPDNAEQGNFSIFPDSVIVDEDNSLVGILFCAPRIVGTGRCTMTLGNEDSQVEAKVDFDIYPATTSGFEINGKRPTADDPNPSNIKTTLMSVSTDINSEYRLGVCVGVKGGFAEDLAKAAVGYKWNVDGAGVIVESTEEDWNYQSGFVSYINLRAGAREGFAVITFEIPGETLTCNLAIEDFNTSHPVDSVIISYQDKNVSRQTIEVSLDDVIPLQVSVAPDENFEYHIPELSSSDPTVVSVDQRNPGGGYERVLHANAIGTAVITATALDKTTYINVVVKDKVNGIAWASTPLSNLMVGDETTVTAQVTMQSGAVNNEIDIQFTSSDPSVLSVTKTGLNTATITGLAAGEATITASCDGYAITSQPITVSAIQDINLPATGDVIDGNTTGYFDLTDTEINIYYQDFSNSNIDFNADIEVGDVENMTGTHTGTSTSISYNGNTFTGTYTLTFGEFTTAEVDGDEYDGYYVTGEFILDNGMKVVITNLFFINQN